MGLFAPHLTIVIPTKVGIHRADAVDAEAWTPAFASRRNSVPAGGRRSKASPRAGVTTVGKRLNERTTSPPRPQPYPGASANAPSFCEFAFDITTSSVG